jgi:hypothetical protein
MEIALKANEGASANHNAQALAEGWSPSYGTCMLPFARPHSPFSFELPIKWLFDITHKGGKQTPLPQVSRSQDTPGRSQNAQWLARWGETLLADPSSALESRWKKENKLDNENGFWGLSFEDKVSPDAQSRFH